MNTNNVGQARYVNHTFKAGQVKTETISPQTKIIYDQKPDGFVKQERMSTKKKVAIGACVVLGAILAAFAIIRFRGRSGVVNEVRDAGRRIARNDSGALEGCNIPPRNLSRGGQNTPPLPPGGGKAVSPPVAPKSAATKAEQSISTEIAESKGKSIIGQAAEQISEEQRQAYIKRLNGMCNTGSSPFSKVKDLAQGEFYDRIRQASYKSFGNPNISDITKASTDKVHTFPSRGWYFRNPMGVNGVKNSDVVERFSLNVKPDKKLIELLDDYMISHKELGINYKTPISFAGWAERHDPITIYFTKKSVTQQVLDDIARIADPYARETGTSVLRGRPFGKCCAWQRNANEADAHEFFERFERIFGDPNLPKSRKNRWIRRLGGDTSTGQFCAYHDVLNAITGEKFEPLLPKL